MGRAPLVSGGIALGAEDDVKDDVTEGLGHEGNMTENCVRMNRAFSANDIAVNMFLGRCPRL